jgi:hypothetical protein
MKKEKEIVLYVEPNEMFTQDRPVVNGGKTGEIKKKLLYFLYLGRRRISSTDRQGRTTPRRYKPAKVVF